VLLWASHLNEVNSDEPESCQSSSLLQGKFSVSQMRVAIDAEAKGLKEDATAMARLASETERHAEVQLSSAWDQLWRKQGKHNFETCGPAVIMLLTVMLSTGVGLAWLWNLNRTNPSDFQGDGQLEPKPMDLPTTASKTEAPSDWTVRWLRMLTLVTFGVLALQTVLGVITNSATLLGDLGHTASDALTYGFAYLVEVAKADLGRRGAASLDVLSAFFTIILVTSSSVCAVGIALRRLRASEKSAEEELGLSISHMGFTLLFFATLTTSINIGLLLVHRWYKPTISDQASQALGLPGAAASPSTSPASTSSSSTGPRQASFTCMTCPGPQRKMAFIPDTGTSSSPATMTWTSVIHAVVHPGCVGQCGQVQSGGAAGKTMIESLNEYGVLLHLGADVIRSVVIFCSGLLVVTGVIHSVAAADAITALVVVACVIAGSAIILTRVVNQLSVAVYG